MTRISISLLRKTRKAMAIISALFLLASAMVAFADESTTPQVIMQNITNQVMHILQANQGRQLSISEQENIEKIIVPYVDFTLMSRMVMAQYWAQMTPAQQDDFINLYRRQLIQVYMTAFSKYSGQSVQILGSTEVSHNPPIAEVDTKILQTDGRANIPVSYGFIKEGQDWKIYDIFIDGVCMNLTYRDSYGKIIAQEGISRFLELLRKKEDSWTLSK